MTAKENAIAIATEICTNKTLTATEIAAMYDALINNFDVFIDIEDDADAPHIIVDDTTIYYA